MKREKNVRELEKIQWNKEFYVGTHLPLLLNMPFFSLQFECTSSERSTEQKSIDSFWLVKRTTRTVGLPHKNQGDDM